MKQYCFVLMPFGKKNGDDGRMFDFDKVYEDLIHPAIIDSGLEPIRADEEIVGGIIHKPMFERLMICDYAVADLTTANANVFYELGIRHGVRPHSTVPIFASGTRLPFDVAPIRAIPYEVDENGVPLDLEASRKSLSERLNSCRNPVDDSPLFQLLSDLPRPDIRRLKTDVFRDMVEYAKDIKGKLREARRIGKEAVKNIESQVSVIDADPAVVVDIYLSYRAVSDWEGMISLYEKMPPLLQQTIMVQEQRGLALNRLGERDAAIDVLTEIISTHGHSSETCGILGRVYKDAWVAHKLEASAAQDGWLSKAISAYLDGFESDWRDAYPGVNAATLMFCKNPPDSRLDEILPVVAYSVKRRMASRNVDYWDYATLLELALLKGDRVGAQENVAKAMAAIRESWEPKSTLNNIAIIVSAMRERGEDVAWINDIKSSLESMSS